MQGVGSSLVQPQLKTLMSGERVSGKNGPRKQRTVRRVATLI